MWSIASDEIGSGVSIEMVTKVWCSNNVNRVESWTTIVEYVKCINYGDIGGGVRMEMAMVEQL